MSNDRDRFSRIKLAWNMIKTFRRRFSIHDIREKCEDHDTFCLRSMRRYLYLFEDMGLIKWTDGWCEVIVQKKP